jgi:tetratricopeptide (TPR) repeat protein
VAERNAHKQTAGENDDAAGHGPLILSIWREGEKLVIDLIDRAADVPRGETLVKQQFLDELCTEMERIVARCAYSRARNAPGLAPTAVSPEVSALLTELQGVGRLLFSQLLTRPVRDRLKNVTPCDLYLRLDRQLLQIPWELCFDGEQFLAGKFCLGRQVITDSRGDPARPATRASREKLRVLIIADPTETLPEASAEAEQLCALLDDLPSVEGRLKGGKSVKKLALLSLLERMDVVHFAGHSVFDTHTPRASGWLLDDGIVTASELSKLDSPPVLVFSNSCQAGTTAAWREPQCYEGEAYGLGSAFLQAGVPNFIGTFWPVHDADSLDFAVAFYRRLTAGHSLGRALLQARRETMQKHGTDSLTWASYMLYGDPACMLLPGSSPVIRPPKITPSDTLPETPVVPVSAEQAQKVSEKSPGRVIASAAKQSLPQQPHTPRFHLRVSLLLSRLVLIAVLVLAGMFALRDWWLPTPPPSLLWQEYASAWTKLEAGELDDAWAIFQWLVPRPENPRRLGYDGMATIDFEKGDLAAAEEALRDALAADPTNVMALLVQGDLAFTVGEKDKALRAYTQATTAETPEAWQRALAYNALGVFHTLNGQLAEAQHSFNAALQADEESALAIGNLGYLLWQQGMIQDTQRVLERAQSLQPGDEVSQILLTMLTANKSTNARAEIRGKVLILPFLINGGRLRRLGESEALAWRLTAHLSGQDAVTDVQPKRPTEWIRDQAQAVALAAESGAAYVVWGELQSYATQLIIHGQVTDTRTGVSTRLSHMRQGTTGRLEAAAQTFAEQIASVVQKGE